MDRFDALPFSLTLEHRVKSAIFVHVLGIDLGGGKRKKTAPRPCASTVRRLRSSTSPLVRARCRSTMPHCSRRSVSYGDETLLCIDAPLTLPPCLRCAVPVCPGQEACVDPSVVQMRGLAAELRSVSPTATPGVASRHHPLHPARHRGPPRLSRRHRGARSARPGDRPPRCPCQPPRPRAGGSVHPQRKPHRGLPASDALPPRPHTPFKKHLREREARASILDALSDELRFGPGIWRERCVQSDHLFEAVVCAFTGFLWARDGWTVPAGMEIPAAGDDAARLRAGWIWTPPAAEAAARSDGPPEVRRQGLNGVVRGSGGGSRPWWQAPARHD